MKKKTYNGAGGHVVHETTEEGLGGEVSVVLLEEIAGGLLGIELGEAKLSVYHVTYDPLQQRKILEGWRKCNVGEKRQLSHRTSILAREKEIEMKKIRKETYGLELEGNELETLVLETLDDLTNETTLDTVGLNLFCGDGKCMNTKN